MRMAQVSSKILFQLVEAQCFYQVQGEDHIVSRKITSTCQDVLT